GPNRNLVLPTNSTTLNGSGSDSDGSIVEYIWAKQSGPFATMSNANTANLSLSDLVEGTYVFRLTVKDNDGLTHSDNTMVIVSAENQPPVANAGVDKSVKLPTNSITLMGSGSDADGSITTYNWTKVSPLPATLSNQNTPSLTVTNMVEGTYYFRLTVTDDD